MSSYLSFLLPSSFPTPSILIYILKYNSDYISNLIYIFQAVGLESRPYNWSALGLNLGSATYQLGDLEKATQPL